MNTSATVKKVSWAGRGKPILLNAVSGFLHDDVLTLSGALTFSTLLSFAPLILVSLWATASLGQGAQDALLNQLQGLIGDDARKAAQSVIDSASQRPALGSIAGVLGLLVAIIGATTVFAQLQTSLNDIWRIERKPVNAVWGWLRHRLLSVGLLAAIGFVLAVSMVFSAGLGTLLSGTGIVWDIVNQLITAVIFGVLFAGLFRYLPDARLPWGSALAGGVATAVLFAFGKAVIGLYLAHGSVGGAYGAAGSLVVLLVWVYYSSAIFFFGAELVKAWLIQQDAPKTIPYAREPTILLAAAKPQPLLEQQSPLDHLGETTMSTTNDSFDDGKDAAREVKNAIKEGAAQVSAGTQKVVRDVRRGAARTLDAASDASAELRDEIEPNVVSTATDTLKRTAQSAKDSSDEVLDAVIDFTMERPLEALGLAAVTGAVIALLLRRLVS